MKKFFLAVLAVFVVSGANAQQPAFPDIPAGHWAADAVNRITDLGLIIGFPDGTFRGNESFTRYQASLVFDRLLNVIGANMQAMQAMTDADILALRNALQEVASDVAAQGTRLTNVESIVGTIANDTVSNAARIAALEGAIATLEARIAALPTAPAPAPSPDVTGMREALQDLQNQLNALRVTGDTASARAEAAEALANNAFDRIADLEARVRRNTRSIDALNALIAILNQDILALQAAVGNLGAPAVPGELPVGLVEEVRRNTSDIANIREFVILLRRNQVAMEGRIAAIEESDAAQNVRLDGLEGRVTALESQAISITGALNLRYRVMRLSGFEGAYNERPFDVDRIFGYLGDTALVRQMEPSVFSSGIQDAGDAAGLRRQDRADISEREGAFEPGLTFNIAFNTDRIGRGSLNEFGTVLRLGLRRATNLMDGTTNFTGYAFTVQDLVTTFSPIGGGLITFQFGEAPRFRFTPYIMNAQTDTLGPGFVATVTSPEFLAFLNPTLIVAYGSYNYNMWNNFRAFREAPTADEIATPGAFNQDDFLDAYYRGVRFTLSPLSGFTAGFSYAQLAARARENADAAADNQEITVFGVDAQIAIGPVTIQGEYAQSGGTNTVTGVEQGTPNVASTRSYGSNNSLLYVAATVDGTDIPFLKEIRANYRDIPAAWAGIDTASRPGRLFALDQRGFGVQAGLEIFIFNIDAWFDTYTIAQSGTGFTGRPGGDVTAYGVEAGVNVFRGIVVYGFFKNTTFVSADGTVNETVLRTDGAVGIRRAGNLDVARYGSGFGVGIRHDGAASDALIPNLTFGIEYNLLAQEVSYSRLNLNVNYTLNVSILTISPYAQYESIAGARVGVTERNTLRLGTLIETQPLDIFLRPQLVGAVNYRNTDYTGTNAFTANEFQWSVGVTFNEFLFENSTFTARYGSWTGSNINNNLLGCSGAGIDDWTQCPISNVATVNGATTISAGDENNGVTQSTSGYELTWNYYGLRFDYGVYFSDNGQGTTAGQAFQIRYTVNF